MNSYNVTSGFGSSTHGASTAFRSILSPRFPSHRLIGHSAMLPAIRWIQRHTAAARIGVNADMFTPLSVDVCPAIKAQACGEDKGMLGLSSEPRCSTRVLVLAEFERPNPNTAIVL